MTRDLTTAEALAELKSFVHSIGEAATLSIALYPFNPDSHPVHWVLLPDGYGEGAWRMTGDTETLGSALAEARARYANEQADREREIIRRLAMTIISITYEHGECTDAALRIAGSSKALIEKFGAAACLVANAIAGSGPFSIRSFDVRDNGAPAEADPLAEIQSELDVEADTE